MTMLSTFGNVEFKRHLFCALYLFEFNMFWYEIWIILNPCRELYKTAVKSEIGGCWMEK